jgi:phage shock protein PspC (stress-responsive transcriptional regulator)
MQKVVSINLNGNAYQLDESGYETLSEYLSRAEQQLQGNPDRAEIIADLEQAIADRCHAYLSPHKTVITASEIARIVAEMGPVDEGAATGEARDARPQAAAGRPEDARAEPAKRLFRLPDRAVIAGVCAGLAAYVGIDAVIVRILFVVAAVVTQGVAILGYVVLMFVLPPASTPDERAAAGPAPLNARDVVDRAKKQVAEGQRKWRRYQREQHRAWHRRGWPHAPYPHVPPPWIVGFLPILAVAHVALFLVAAAMVISLVNTGAILQWRLPADVPLWAAVLILLVAYQIVVSPIRAAEHWTKYSGPGMDPASFAFWNAAAWLIGLAFVVWIASNHIPEIREFVQRLPELARAFAQAAREFFQGAAQPPP